MSDPEEVRTPDLGPEELDALDALELTPGYGLLMASFQADLKRRRDELELRKNEEATAFVRGQISTLREVLGRASLLRSQVSAEIKRSNVKSKN